MFYRITADLTVICHLLWIMFLIFGAVIGVRIKWVRITHLAALGFSVLLQLNGWICPLTHFEVWLRRKAGGGYSGEFIRHYMEKLVYLDVSRWLVFTLTVAVIGVKIWLYFFWLVNRKRR